MKDKYDLIIDDLSKQISKLAQEKAVMSAIATQKEVENQQLRKELDQYKQSPAKK